MNPQATDTAPMTRVARLKLGVTNIRRYKSRIDTFTSVIVRAYVTDAGIINWLMTGADLAKIMSHILHQKRTLRINLIWDSVKVSVCLPAPPLETPREEMCYWGYPFDSGKDKFTKASNHYHEVSWNEAHCDKPVIHRKAGFALSARNKA